MMMFAIHNARKDWDPLPTAYKLRELEKEFTERQGRSPREAELAEIASMSRGEIRRLKKLLGLPEGYRAELMQELEKPRSEQVLSVDHVLETTKGAAALRNRGVIDRNEEDQLRHAVIDKFRSGVIKNTVAPRQLARIGRAVERGEVSVASARTAARKLIRRANYSIDDAFRESAAQADFEHGVEQLADRLYVQLANYLGNGYEIGDRLRDQLVELRDRIDFVVA